MSEPLQLIATLAPIFFGGVVGGLAGSYCAFALNRAHQARVEGTKLVYLMLSKDFSEKRDVIEKYSYEPKDCVRVEHSQETIVEVLNHYDVIFKSIDLGLVSKRVVKSLVWPLIENDYENSEFVLSEIERRSKENGGDLERPFFPSLRKYYDLWNDKFDPDAWWRRPPKRS